MLRETRAQARHDGLLGAAVGLRDDIDFALIADLHRAVKFRHKNAAGFAGRVNGNFKKWIHAAGVPIFLAGSTLRLERSTKKWSPNPAMNHARSLLDRTGAIGSRSVSSMNKTKSCPPKKWAASTKANRTSATRFYGGLSVPCSSGRRGHLPAQIEPLPIFWRVPHFA